jgi:hypothetical protein
MWDRDHGSPLFIGGTLQADHRWPRGRRAFSVLLRSRLGDDHRWRVTCTLLQGQPPLRPTRERKAVVAKYHCRLRRIGGFTAFSFPECADQHVRHTTGGICR